MASILLSFVGNQDPFSGTTEKLGSIVTLLRELVARQIEIKKVVLLYTTGTQKGAKETLDWIASEADLKQFEVELIPTSAALSEDPTDLLAAALEARRGLEIVKAQLKRGDFIEFNASSGTPAMKAALSMLQAAGYATQGRVWQVRNPKEMQPGQERVYETDVTVLRQEFDRQKLRQLVEEYNYSGALDLVEQSDLLIDESAIALLKAGKIWNQGQFDAFYEKAKFKLDNAQKNQTKTYWWQAYEQGYTAVVRLKQGNSTEAMLHSFRAVEGLLYQWVLEHFSQHLQNEKKASDYKLVKISISQKYPSLRDDFDGEDEKKLNRWMMIKIFKAFDTTACNNPDFQGWCNANDDRNELSHHLGGISEQELYGAWRVKNAEQWEARLLACLNLLTEQKFDKFMNGALLPVIHHHLLKALTP
ncbi:hypothetical protein VB712_17875 [Spirulina sp. CCNP1310]|uniref:hypothetical protein n=1 Tax=Spirulina sp. CCNP1310 TaxID=3110249 RepID=UPI002B210C62|nr:hypothetical protein [Spirulina sp. CCNP1310]MEA5421098.1 hypothetical protein [Spirulina sp. CCNP1310]